MTPHQETRAATIAVGCLAFAGSVPEGQSLGHRCLWLLAVVLGLAVFAALRRQYARRNGVGRVPRGPVESRERRTRGLGLGLGIVCLALVWPAHTRAQEEDPRCEPFFEQATRKLAAGQYPAMLRLARESMERCPGPKSSFILGLAQANLVDKLIITDPAERELMRREAIRNLEYAGANGATTLKPEWSLTLYEWVRTLERLGPPPNLSIEHVPHAQGAAADSDDYLDPLDLGPEFESAAAPAPPPPAQPVFPLGPLVVGGLGAGALVAALVTGIEAGEARDEADETAAALRASIEQLTAEEADGWVRRVQQTSDEADALGDWSTALLVGGSAGVLAGVLWYALIPPEGKWRWAMTPTGVQATARF